MKKRFLALFIVCVMLFAQVSVFANGIDSTSDSYETDIDTAVDDIESVLSDENSNELVVLEEITGLRESNIKHFSLSNGTNKAVLYPQPVHYMDENGNWVDINNSLTLNGNEYSTKNKFEIKFANKSGSSGLLSIKDGEYKIDFTPLGTNKVNVSIENPQENNSRKFEDVSALNHLVSRATYSNIYNGIDIEYILIANNIKENIIVNSKQDNYTFSFELKLNKLTAELANGEIILSDSTTGETIYTIPAPYMYDADNVMSTEVEYSLVQNSKWKYTFTVTANSEWINADERAFPVTIDPTIISDSADENSVGVDTHVMSDNDNYFSTDSIIIGNFFGDADIPGFIKFNQLPDIQQGTYLVQAKLAMSIRTIYNDNNIEFYAGIYRATNDWTLDPNFSYATAWSYYDDTPESGVQILETGPYEWDITSLYKDWKNGAVENHGICVKAVCLDSDAPVAAIIYSIDSGNVAPRLELTYVEPKGIDDDFALLNTPIGDVGNSYVNLFNGNLTYINNITTIETQSLSYEINMVYNSTDNSWIASFDEKITLFENPDDDMGDNIIRYLWHDPDGTIHYFTPYLQKNWWGDYVQYEAVSNDCLEARSEPTVFYPEDDIDYVLTKTPTGDFILKNYNGTQKYFDSNGKLLKICDAQGNVLFLSYKDGNLSCIDCVTIDNIQIPQVEFTYAENNKLSLVHNFVTNSNVSLIWDGNVLLKTEYNDIGDTENKVVDICYVEGSTTIEKIKDSSESKYIKYTLNEYGKVLSVQLYNDSDNDSDNDILLTQYDVEYNLDNTIYTDCGNDSASKTDDKKHKYTFDERGRKVVISESCGDSDNFVPGDPITYKTDIIPDNVYYTVSYSNNINSELTVSGNETSIVRFDLNTGEKEFIGIADLFSPDSILNILPTANEATSEESATNTADTITPRDIIGSDNRVLVTDTTEYPYNSICYIKTTYYGVYNNVENKFESRTTIGSGVLVGPNLVLTAGHNLYDDITEKNSNFYDGVHNPRFAERIVVYPGAYLGENNEIVPVLGSFEVSASYIQLQYHDNTTFDYDIGLCVLEESVENQVGYLNMSITFDDIINKNIKVVGYPSDKNGDMYYSIGTVVRVDSYRFFYNADTVGGNSGSPVFVNNGNYTVIGIHTSGFNADDNDYSNDFNGATRITSFVYTIATILKLNE